MSLELKKIFFILKNHNYLYLNLIKINNNNFIISKNLTIINKLEII